MSTYASFQTQPRTLNAVQLMLLRLFNRNLSEQQTADIQTLLLNYLNEQLQLQLDLDMAQKGITQADLNAQLNESQRTKLP
jgi:hypothetical protein